MGMGLYFVGYKHESLKNKKLKNKIIKNCYFKAILANSVHLSNCKNGQVNLVLYFLLHTWSM